MNYFMPESAAKKEMYRRLRDKNGSIELRLIDSNGAWIQSVEVPAQVFEQDPAFTFTNSETIIFEPATDDCEVCGVCAFVDGRLATAIYFEPKVEVRATDFPCFAKGKLSFSCEGTYVGMPDESADVGVGKN